MHDGVWRLGLNGGFSGVWIRLNRHSGTPLSQENLRDLSFDYWRYFGLFQR